MRGLKRLDALHRYGAPESMTTDQGSQFTGAAFSSVLKAAGVRVRIHGRGCGHDHVSVKRLWKSIKYEAVYLRAYESLTAARAAVGQTNYGDGGSKACEYSARLAFGYYRASSNKRASASMVN